MLRAIIIPLILFLSGCNKEKLVLADTLDTTDNTIVKPFGVHLGVDKYLDGNNSASDWLAVERNTNGNPTLKGLPCYYYSVEASTPEINTDFDQTTYLVDKLTNTIVGVEFSKQCITPEERHQMSVFVRTLCNALDKKYQDFFIFKGNWRLGAPNKSPYEMSTSKIQNGAKVRYTKKFTNIDAAKMHIDNQNILLTGSPFAYDGFVTSGNTAFNPRTTYRYYSKFMDELNRIDDITIIFRSSQNRLSLTKTALTYSHPAYTVSLSYFLSSEYTGANYATKWNKAVRDALSMYDIDTNNVRVESQHY